MKLTLKRIEFKADRTFSKLYINDEFFCDVLEDVDRGLDSSMSISELLKLKIKHQTAIPTGVYKVTLTYSPRFKAVLPLLLNVPAYSGIRAHSGGNPEHTSGCLLVGVRVGDVLIRSRTTLAKLIKILSEAENPRKATEPITISITRV